MREKEVKSELHTGFDEGRIAPSVKYKQSKAGLSRRK